MYSRNGLFAVLLAVGAVSAAQAAPVRLVVDKKGTLHVSPEVAKSLQVKPADNGMVCVEFPVPAPKKSPRPASPPPTKRDPHGHAHAVRAERRPRVWVAQGRDGSVTVRRTRLVPADDYVPGPAGTAYLATGKKGCVILNPAPRR